MKTYIGIILAFILSTNCIQAQSNAFKTYKAFNGITFEYALLLPENFDSNKSYKTIVSFAGVEPKDDLSEATITTLWKNHKRHHTIVIVPKVPIGESDWISHPIHHGFNDFLKFIKGQFKVKNKKFHFVGYQGGCVPAQTYISMLDFPPASLTVLSSDNWDHYDDKNYSRLSKLEIPIHLIYHKSNERGIKKGRQVEQVLKAKGTEVTLKISEDFIAELESMISKN
ncbi:hypothetical protein A9Q87_08905 [Flavobacteriales bacterium 34_180_T64]|nr:hypothetical protein A9Q87_08905 [Flavobacteriales bacterium 34_180_T64]